MQTVKTADQVTSEVQGAWYLRTQENDEEWESGKHVNDMDEAELASAANILKCSPELLSAINEEFNNIREATHNELADIYSRQQ